MHPEFGAIVKAASDAYGDELKEQQIVELFNKEYTEFKGKYTLLQHRFTELRDMDGTTETRFEGYINENGAIKMIVGSGNGPIDQLLPGTVEPSALPATNCNYHEHAISRGSDALGICYY